MVKLSSYNKFLVNTSADNSGEPFFDYSLNCVDCIVTVNCSTTLSDKGNCTIEYGPDPDLGPPISGPLNSSLTLPLKESSTLYYIQIRFMTDFEFATFRRNYTTRNLNGSYNKWKRVFNCKLSEYCGHHTTHSDHNPFNFHIRKFFCLSPDFSILPQ